MPHPRPPLLLRLKAWLPFLASAVLGAVILRLSWDAPWLGAVALAAIAWFVLSRRRQQRRLQALALSGRTDELVNQWEQAVADLPQAETLLPLIHATAFTSSGLTDRAREALERGRRAGSWESTEEHRLIVETLLDAFEGDRQRAMDKARRLASLPVPPVGPMMRARILELRRALMAFARAFAHDSGPGDGRLLRHAAKKNPLIHWPFRYAAAVAFIDHGKHSEAQRLLRDAPAWPADSAFAAFQEELSEHASPSH
ncbi:MAG: hypothetical protein R3B13_18960 [Polyangiaceae bacterium]